MKTKRTFNNLGRATFIIALSSFIFISCDQQEIESPDSMKDTPITIASAGVAELSTRAITDGKLVGTADETATMSIFITGGSETKYNANNIMWEHNGTSWTSEETVLFEGAASSQKIAAYRPFDANATSGSVTVIATEQTDWLVATEKQVTSNSMTLTMTHALTKLVLVPTYGNEVVELQRNIDKVEVGGMYASGTLSISDNKWSSCGTTNATLEMRNNELLVIPMADCSSFPIVITMEDGRRFTTDISLARANNQLAPGTQYNIKLQIGQNKVIVEQISMSDFGSPFGDGWNNEEDLN